MEDYPVICRQWARAQRHAERAQQEWAQAVARLSSEVVRLRGQVLVLRTALLWGVRAPGLVAGKGRSTAMPACVTAREAVCLTGCHGHGHPWLGHDGHCRLDGVECPSAPARAGDPHGQCEPAMDETGLAAATADLRRDHP